MGLSRFPQGTTSKLGLRGRGRLRRPLAMFQEQDKD